MALKIGKGATAPPFLVMDVIAAANARANALPPGAPRVIRMEVGQPGTGAPAGAVAAATEALRSGMPLGYTEALGRRSLRARIAAHYRADAGWTCQRRAWQSLWGHRARSRWPFWRHSIPATSGVRADSAVLPALCQHSDRAWHPAGDPGQRQGRNPLPAQRRHARAARSAARRVDRRQSVQSRRDDAHPEELAAIATGAKYRGRATDRRRDLPRPELRQSNRQRRVVQLARSGSGPGFSKYFSMTGWRIGWLGRCLRT